MKMNRSSMEGPSAFFPNFAEATKKSLPRKSSRKQGLSTSDEISAADAFLMKYGTRRSWSIDHVLDSPRILNLLQWRAVLFVDFLALIRLGHTLQLAKPGFLMRQSLQSRLKLIVLSNAGYHGACTKHPNLHEYC